MPSSLKTDNGNEVRKCSSSIPDCFAMHSTFFAKVIKNKAEFTLDQKSYAPNKFDGFSI